MAVSDYFDPTQFYDAIPGMVGGLAAGVLGLNANSNANAALQSAYAPNSYDQQYQQLSQQLMQLTGQLADTNNPQFQARVKQREDEIMRQYEQTLRQQQAAEARRYGRTGMGMVNPERRDEAIARSLATFRSQAQAQARAEAMGEMVNAAKVGQGTAPVVQVGSTTTRGREVAGANVNNAYDQNKKSTYLALAGQVLGPLMKGIDFKKMIEGTTGGGVTSAPAMAGPNDSTGLYDPGYGYGQSNIPTFAAPSQSWGANPSGGIDIPSFDMGQFPSAGTDTGGMYDPGYGYAAPDFNFPAAGADVGGTFDPGYGYAAPTFDPASFSTPSFDFPSFGGDFGSFFDPGYGY